MVVLNELDRFRLATDVIDRAPRLAGTGGYAKQEFRHRLIEHRQYIERYGDDPSAIRDWRRRQPRT
jgi:xylulose-5-phosphate/fructose-6-phosphate phosphoketolase